MAKPFQFKQFSVHQDRSAMKIGTDGVLLGAWASLENRPNSILDIGAGTGILALMLAQRSNAKTIDAIEIDDNAYEQSVENFEQSPWGDRLFCYHASLEDFALEMFSDDDEAVGKYDLIVCNPPYFKPPLPSGSTTSSKEIDSSRSLARFQDAMPFEQLLESVSQLLSPEGLFSVVIPFSEEKKFLSLAFEFGLFSKKICHVHGHTSAEIKRSLMSFSFQDVTTEFNKLVIEINRHEYTQDYIDLTKDFYLKM